ncbi:anti-sigma factor antagonist [Paratractidigestivibacter sp.]|uniref:anti-sigma factor antagonist n=1 Tax=Paratractidigestivibacter sp. TaxID=2847316 RepID=UPI002AC9640C|nr:anti-sigma factor antagonist [Paratractidigestivibacter sp.]
MAHYANIAQVIVDGDLDVRSVPGVRRTLDGLIDSGCRRVVLNMANATYADSSGMGLILGELRRMHEVGGLLSLTNVSARVYQALCLMRMTDFVPISREGAANEVPDLPANALPRSRTTFRVDADRLERARRRIEQLISALPLTEDGAFDIGLASGEAVGNAVDHTDADGVLVTVAVYDDRVVVDVADCGDGFSPAEHEAADVDACSERGRGIKLMQLLADSVTISPKTTGAGTVVRLVKMFPKPAVPAA